MDYLNDLHEFFRMIMHAIVEAKEQVRATGKLLPSDMEYIDCLVHTLKCLKTVIAMEESEKAHDMEEEMAKLKEEVHQLKEKMK